LGVVHHGPGAALRPRELPHRPLPYGDRRPVDGRLGRPRARTALLRPLPFHQLLLRSGRLQPSHPGRRRGRRRDLGLPRLRRREVLATSNLPGATWGADLYPEIAKGYNPIDNVGTYRDKRVFLRTGDGPWFDFFDGLEDHPDIWSTLQAKLEQIGADIIENAVHPHLAR